MSYRFNVLLFTLISLLWLLASPAWSTEDIRVCQTHKARYQYRIELANLMLERTSDEYGPAYITPYDLKNDDPTQARCELLLEQGKVDLVYLPATEQRLTRFNAIKQDIHQGMLGYRVLTIRREDQAIFNDIDSLNELRKFTGGFGKQWGDFKVFELNKLPVVGVVETKNLYGMLAAGRFDYFHRGLHEAWAEIDEISPTHPDLIVEQHLAIVYDFPVYFMVNRKDQTLYNRLQKAFSLISQDGSFQSLFLRHFSLLAKQARLSERTFLRIDYPLPSGLPKVETKNLPAGG